MAPRRYEIHSVGSKVSNCAAPVLGKATSKKCDVIVVLVDTSIWIEVLRRGDGLDLESLVDFEEVVTCPPG